MISDRPVSAQEWNAMRPSVTVSPSVFAETSQASQCGGPQLRLSSTTNLRARCARPQVGNRSR